MERIEKETFEVQFVIFKCVYGLLLLKRLPSRVLFERDLGYCHSCHGSHICNEVSQYPNSSYKKNIAECILKAFTLYEALNR